jgi:hypothetical protein
MTPDEMRAEIEAVYAAAIRRAAVPGAHPPIRAGLAGPAAGITPMSWTLSIPAQAETLTREEFRVQFGDHAGEELASQGLSYGCTQFARLTVQDRPAVKVASQGGRGVPRIRPRAFIVHALGWGHKVPEFVHTPSWPHRMGADVPETSKRPKGDVQ